MEILVKKILFCLLIFFCVLIANTSFEPVLSSEYDEKKAYIGKKLFFDKRLSTKENYSCETCHNLYWNLSGSNSSLTSQKGVLNPPSVLNAALNFIFFVDGRARSLKEQVSESIISRNELNSNQNDIVEKVKNISEYVVLFKSAFNDGVNYENIVSVLVEFEKAVLSIDSPFDEYLAGNNDAISLKAKKGFQLFTKVGCIACHTGRNIGGNLMQRVGLKDVNDIKRLSRVPSLRNVARTAPYLSSGDMNDLKEVISFVSYHQLLHTLNNEEIEQIYQFLLTLNGRKPRILNE